ncbi:hypothetical protein DPMN_090698 [Dreissena polymorpha]|uniref:Uncharacterized protein n=1 Tax=Dreissena polymorpha TaxID=45954 RepID=A0A9D4QZ89_DREPO|nr:hypothetical protein DPMN_090698 [Dreissena polymorpha]
MLQTLHWNILAHRRMTNSLIMLYKTHHHAASQRGPLSPYPYKKLKLFNPHITYPESHEFLLSPHYKLLERSFIPGQIKPRSRFLQSETRGG